jgi:hypothetical protein
MATANAALAEAIDAAGWSPRELVRAVNLRLAATGRDPMDLTACHGWLRGSVPRSRYVCALAAIVLSEATGRHYTSAQLWGTQGTEDSVHATNGLLGPLHLRDVLQAAAAWTSGLADPALARPATGARLAAAVRDATRQPHVQPASARHGTWILPEHADMLEQQLAALRRMDDRTGGGPFSQRTARLVMHESVILLNTGRYEPATGARLIRHAAGAAQLAGWLSFDASLHPAAHRYLLLAIRLGRAAGDAGTVANALGMLAYQHAATGDPAGALQLAEAALDHSAHVGPLALARAWGRLATARAAAGDLPGFREAAGECRRYLDRPGDGPAALYYLTPLQADAEAGHALVDLVQSGSMPRRRTALLAEANALLAPIASRGTAAGYRRSALLHAIHLVRAGIAAHDTHMTAHWLERAASHLPEVQSVRCRALLQSARDKAGSQLRAAGMTSALDAADAALAPSGT